VLTVHMSLNTHPI